MQIWGAEKGKLHAESHHVARHNALHGWVLWLHELRIGELSQHIVRHWPLRRARAAEAAWTAGGRADVVAFVVSCAPVLGKRLVRTKHLARHDFFAPLLFIPKLLLHDVPPDVRALRD